MYTNTTQYLRALASDLVHGCRRTAADGTVIYTPDGTASYDGLWLRDFSYMVEYAGFAIPDQDIVNCIRYAVRHRRADGWMPDRVTTDGLAVYAAGIAAAPVGEANLDNTPFLIFTVDSLSRRMDTDAFLPLFTEWEAVLEQGRADVVQQHRQAGNAFQSRAAEGKARAGKCVVLHFVRPHI